MDKKRCELYTCIQHVIFVLLSMNSRLDGVLAPSFGGLAEIATQNPRPDPDNTGVGIKTR